jgi:Ca-activated chloride channel family protein
VPSLHHFGFAAPLALLALLAVPLFYALVVVVRRRRSRYVVFHTRLSTLARAGASSHGHWRRRAPLVLLGLALAATAAALAQPRVRVTGTSNSATIELVADVSGSMEATDIRPSRLIAAIAAMRQFLAAVPSGDKVGLLAFSDAVEILNTPTTDRAAVASNLDVLNPEGGTALGAAVESAVRVIVTSLAEDGVRRSAGGTLPAAIVLESDGAQDRGTVTPFAAAEMAKAAGIRVYGVALGTRHGFITEGIGPLSQSVRVLPDPGVIALLARETGGESFSATSAGQLDTIYRQLGTRIDRVPRQTDITSWFELAAAVLLVGGVAAARGLGPALP